MAGCFQISPFDNVATLLEDAAAGAVDVIGRPDSPVILMDAIKMGHKVSLCTIPAGDPVLKYGIPIGVSTRLINAGEWVHLHNCRSQTDERSGTLDADTGAPSDTQYE